MLMFLLTRNFKMFEHRLTFFFCITKTTFNLARGGGDFSTKIYPKNILLLIFGRTPPPPPELNFFELINQRHRKKKLQSDKKFKNHIFDAYLKAIMLNH